MSTPPRPLPPKKDVALALLQGPSLFIHLDPRKPEVCVPLHFKKQAQLVLQVGLNMAVPIPDLHVDDEGVTCTLSFNRAPFWCRLPWSAVYALVGEDKRGMIWPDEVPAEVESAQRKQPEAQPGAQGAAAKPRGQRGSKKRERLPREREEEGRATAAQLKSGEAAGQGREMRTSARPLAPLPVSARPLTPTAPTARTAGAPSSKGADEAAKPGKRELPPYLRVVK